jgi:HK97 gp10 family phage protein
MLDIEVGVKGRSDLQAKLDKLKKQASPQQLAKALEAGGNVFKQAIEERTPIRTPGGSEDALAPGELRGDIHVTVHVGSHAVSVTVGPSSKTKRVMRLLEYGHAIVSRLSKLGKGKSGVASGQVPAHPVMRPAYEASKDEAMRAVIESLQQQEGD